MHPWRSLEKSFLTMYNMLPNYQMDKTMLLDLPITAGCSDTEENDG